MEHSYYSIVVIVVVYRSSHPAERPTLHRPHDSSDRATAGLRAGCCPPFPLRSTAGGVYRRLRDRGGEGEGEGAEQTQEGVRL